MRKGRRSLSGGPQDHFPVRKRVQVRVSGKSKDDLQKVISMCREKDLGIALQFANYRS